LTDQQAPDEQGICIFQKGPVVWKLSFNGVTAHIPDVLGMGYIAELLRHPRTMIEVATLVANSRGSTDTSAEAVEQRVVPADAAMPGMPMSDPKTIRAVKAELEKRRAEFRKGLTEDNPKLQDQIKKLERYLAQVAGRDGLPRVAGGLASRARSSVKHAVDRAITKIAKQHPALADHLRRSIHTGTSLIYSPAEVPAWQF
jgi:hypothetical protein